MEDRNIARLVRVPDVDKVIEFEGQLVADVTTELPDAPRWTEMDLYHLTDGTGRYVLHVVGRSVVYHRHDSECNSGTKTPLIDVPDDAEPCPNCHPSEGHIYVDVEDDRHSAHVCADAQAVLVALRSTGSRATSRPFSTPALRLLATARQRDPAIDALMSGVERI
jgi:hypothetical protein